MKWLSSTQYSEWRFKKISHCRALPDELRVEAYGEIGTGTLPRRTLQNRDDNGFGRPRKNGASQHDPVKSAFLAQGLPDFTTCALDMAQIQLAIALTRRAHAYQRNL